MTPTEVLLGANAVSAQVFGGHVMAYWFRIFRLGRLRHAAATYRPNDNPFAPKRFRAMTFNEPPACSLRCRRSQAKALGVTPRKIWTVVSGRRFTANLRLTLLVP